MKIPDRNTAVFSTSAIDLFASALGAFILLVMLLFPYYRHSGTNEAFSRTQDIMQKRRLASADVENMLADLRESQNEVEQLTRLLDARAPLHGGVGGELVGPRVQQVVIQAAGLVDTPQGVRGHTHRDPLVQRLAVQLGPLRVGLPRAPRPCGSPVAATPAIPPPGRFPTTANPESTAGCIPTPAAHASLPLLMRSAQAEQQ